MRTILVLLTLALAPAAVSQAPPKPEYRKLEIAEFYCRSENGDSSDSNGCLGMLERGKVVWNFPNCSWTQKTPASCTVRGTPNASGSFGDPTVSCSDRKFEKPARQCLKAHKLKAEHKGDLTPVCVTFDFPERDRKTAVGRIMSPPIGPAIKELASCPAPAGQ